MEIWEIELEHEIEVFLENQHKALCCPKCGWLLQDNKCPNCGKVDKSKGKSTEYYVDPDFDEYYDKIEKEVEEFQDEIEKAKWEEVPDKEIGEIPSAEGN
jgi:hypothetical protein